MLGDVENNYSDALAPVHINYSESQNGAMSHLNPMTAEEARSQFGHLGVRMDQIKAGFNTVQASLDELRNTMGVLIPHRPNRFPGEPIPYGSRWFGTLTTLAQPQTSNAVAVAAKVPIPTSSHHTFSTGPVPT